MPQTEEEYQRTVRSEKARTVVWLGFLSIILAVRLALHDGDFLNFWCNSPCIHVTIFLVPTFTTWIELWLGYIVCMIVYFSEDWFHRFSWGRDFREIVRRIGTRIFILFYPLTVLFFGGVGGGSVLLPDSAQAAYWFAATGLLGFMVIWTAEGVMGRKIVGKKGLLNRGIESFVELTRDGMEVVGETLVHMWRRLLAKVGHPTRGPTHPKQAVRLVVSALTLGVVAIAWGIANLSGFNLLIVLEVTLYAIVIALIIVGRFKKGRAEDVKEKISDSHSESGG